jgi:hypothetical protein
MPASSISRLCGFGLRIAAMASAKTTAKNRMPLSGTIAKAIPSSVSPIAAERFIALTADQEAEDRHRGRQRYADHSRSSDAGRSARRGEPALEHEEQRPGEEQHAVKMDDRVAENDPFASGRK